MADGCDMSDEEGSEAKFISREESCAGEVRRKGAQQVLFRYPISWKVTLLYSDICE